MKIDMGIHQRDEIFMLKEKRANANISLSNIVFSGLCMKYELHNVY